MAGAVGVEAGVGVVGVGVVRVGVVGVGVVGCGGCVVGVRGGSGGSAWWECWEWGGG